MEDVIVEYKHCLEYIAQQIDNFKIMPFLFYIYNSPLLNQLRF